jgi:glycosyl transferase family 25
MRALVLNLAFATERLAFMAGQLDTLGLPWDRVQAVSPETLDPPQDDQVWHRWERPLRPTEMAACASHMRAWQRIVELEDACLVLEDDALLDRSVPDLLARLASTSLDFDHVTLETRGRKKLLARGAKPEPGLRRLFLDRTGAAAYVLSPRGAQKLLNRAARARGLADGLICAAHDLRSYQADPALAIQLDQCAAFGVTPPLAVASQIGAAAKPGKGGLPFRARRIRAQVVQGLRQLRPGTERRLVAPAGNWITTAADPADTRAAPETAGSAPRDRSPS